MKKRIMLVLLATLLVFTLFGSPALAKDENKVPRVSLSRNCGMP